MAALPDHGLDIGSIPAKGVEIRTDEAPHLNRPAVVEAGGNLLRRPLDLFGYSAFAAEAQDPIRLRQEAYAAYLRGQGAAPVELGDETLEKLRSLGYVQ